MKFLIIGDLHGHKPKIYRKDFDYIIAPGDFCSDELRKYMFQAIKLRIQDKYIEIDWWDIIGKKKAKRMVDKSIRNGRKILEFLNSFNVPVFLVPGNWDWTNDKTCDWAYLRKNHYSELTKRLNNLVDVNYKLRVKKGLSLIGYGISSGPEYPQHKSDIKKYTKIELKKLKKLYKKEFSKVNKLFIKSKKKKNPVVYISHNVPFRTKLDKIINPASPKNGYHYGSVITRNIIKNINP